MRLYGHNYPNKLYQTKKKRSSNLERVRETSLVKKATYDQREKCDLWWCVRTQPVLAT